MKRRLVSDSKNISERACYRCGGKDYLANDCPSHVCFHCGKPGHLARDCPWSNVPQGGDNAAANSTMENLRKAQSWSVDSMFGGGRTRSNAVATDSGVAAAKADRLNAANRNFNSSMVKEDRFPCPAWVAPEPQVPYARFKVFKGSDLVQIIHLAKQSVFLIGRQKGLCDILLEHPTISRKHAALVHHRDGSVHLIDLGSAHGTWVGSNRLAHQESRELLEGHVLVFGQSTRRYSAHIRKPIEEEIFSRRRSSQEVKKKLDPSKAMGNLLQGYGSDDEDAEEENDAGHSSAHGSGQDSDDEGGLTFGWEVPTPHGKGENTFPDNVEQGQEQEHKAEPEPEPELEKREEQQEEDIMPARKKRKVSWAVEAELVRVHEVEAIYAINARLGPEDSEDEPKHWSEQESDRAPKEAKHVDEDEDDDDEAFFTLGGAMGTAFQNVKVDSGRETAAKKMETANETAALATIAAPLGSLMASASTAEPSQPEAMEWFCDQCDEIIDGERWECTQCPDEFCLCAKCKALGHLHPLLPSRSHMHITKLIS